MKTIVKMRNPATHENVEVKVGWSWTLLFFSSFFGIPFFLRKLNHLGIFFLVFWVIGFLLGLLNNNTITLFISLINISMNIWFALKGNEITAKNYLKRGFEFVSAESDEVKFAKSKWNLSE